MDCEYQLCLIVWDTQHIRRNSANTSAGAALSLHCSRDQGAFLVIQTHGVQTKVIHQARDLLATYILKYRDSWHTFSEKLHLTLTKSDLIMISGFIKTTNWALGAFERREVEFSFDVSGDIGPAARAGISLSIEHASNSSVQPRVGPTARTVRACVGPYILNA